MRNPTRPSFGKSLIVLAASGLLTACGGGDKTEDGVVQFASQIASQTRAYALKADVESTLPISFQAVGATASTTDPAAVTATMVLDWAQFKFPELFPKALAQTFPAVVYNGVVYNARAYSGPWGIRYLGITLDGRIFGLGDFTNQALQQFDSIRVWATQVVADRCGVNPASCGTSAPAGPLNDCTMPAAQALATGSRFIATYETSGSSISRFTTDSTVRGASTFEGQSAIRIEGRMEGTSTSSGQTITIVNEANSYSQDGGNGFVRNLGSLNKSTTSGAFGSQVSNFKTVLTPGELNAEFSIQPGQSITLSGTATSTIDGLPGFSSSNTSTFTFVVRENLTVRGKAYATCRYTERDINDTSSVVTSWFVRGKGVPVRIEDTNTSGGVTTTEVTELVSGSINGAPI